MNKHARNPKHLAEQSAVTIIRENQAWLHYSQASVAQNFPSFGKHRAVGDDA